MRILTMLALVSASGALLAQAPKSSVPPSARGYFVDGVPLRADSVLLLWSTQPDSLRRRLLAAPDLACPMPVSMPPDSVELTQPRPAATSRFFQFSREPGPPVSGMPTVKSGCYNPLYQPRDSE